MKLTENSALISECNSLRKENNSLKRHNERLRLEAKEMAARPNQAQLQQPKARPGNAPAYGSSAAGGGGGGGINDLANGTGVKGRGGGGRGGAAGSAADEGMSQQSRSVGDSASITVMPAVSHSLSSPLPLPLPPFAPFAFPSGF